MKNNELKLQELMEDCICEHRVDKRGESFQIVYPGKGSKVAVTAAFRDKRMKHRLGFIAATLDGDTYVIDEYCFNEGAVGQCIDRQMIQIMRDVCVNHKCKVRISQDLSVEVQHWLREIGQFQ